MDSQPPDPGTASRPLAGAKSSGGSGRNPARQNFRIMKFSSVYVAKFLRVKDFLLAR
jgi:hypothetical protein